MAEYQVFGLPNNNDVIDANMNVLYGLAYYSEVERDWVYYKGSFPFIYACYALFQDEMYDDDADRAIAIFHLNEEHQPIQLINNMFISATLAPYVGREGESIITGLVVIYNNPTPMNFKPKTLKVHTDP